MVDKDELRIVPLFGSLSEDELAQVAKMLERQSFAKGDEIYAQEGPGGKLYILRQGEASVTISIRKEQKQKLITLGRGSYFGAISLIDGGPHSASVRAKSDTEVFILSRESFEALADDNPVCAIKILRPLTVSLNLYLRQMNNKFADMVHYVTHNQSQDLG